MPNITTKQMAASIDNTVLKNGHTRDDIIRICNEAVEYGFRAVCVQPMWVSLCRQIIGDKEPLVCAVGDFHFGMGGESVKECIANCIRNAGGDEWDTVVNWGYWGSGMYKNFESELYYGSRSLPTKVILKISPDRKLSTIYKMAQAVGEVAKDKLSKIFCLKTNTGFEPKMSIDQKLRYIEVMKKAAPHLKIKVAQDVKSSYAARRFLANGADIIGTSSGIKIIGG